VGALEAQNGQDLVSWVPHKEVLYLSKEALLRRRRV
jgi:hypothetical protein